MIVEKERIIEKIGKEGFKRFVMNNRSNQPTGHDRTKGIRGRVRWSRCEHGVWVVEDYEPRSCPHCQEKRGNTKTPDFKPYFNIGLGAYVESRSDERKLAKAKGYVEAG